MTVKYNIPQDIQGSGDPDPVEFNIITKQGERESNTVNYTYDKVTIVELDEPQIIQNDDTTCTIKVTGLSEPGATVVITIDGEKPQEKTITLGDEQYEFEVEFTVEQTVLYQKLNINATATDTANNTATLEQAVEVTINPSNKLLTLSLVEDTGISSKPETLTDKVTSKTDIKVDGIDDFNATSYVWSSNSGATWNTGNSSVFQGTTGDAPDYNVNILAALSQNGTEPDENAGDYVSFDYTYDKLVEGITKPKDNFKTEFENYLKSPDKSLEIHFDGSRSREETIIDYTFSQKGQEDQTDSFQNYNMGDDYGLAFKVINNGENFTLTVTETDYAGNTQKLSSIQGTAPLDIEYIDNLSASINLEPYYTNRVETSLNSLGWKDLQNQNLVLVGDNAIVSVDELNNEATTATVYFRVDYKLSDKNINASDNFNDHISVKINDVDATVIATNFSGGITSYYKVEVPLSALDTTPGDHQLNSIEVIYTDRNGQTASLLKETVSGEYQYTNGNETKVHLNFAYTVEDTSNGDRSVSDYQYNSNGFATNSLIDDGLQANSGLI